MEPAPTAQPENPVRWRDRPSGLYVAAFLMAVTVSTTLQAAPWRVLDLGGGDLAVGAVGMLWGTYIFSLLVMRPYVDRLGVKRQVIGALLMVLGVMIGLILADRVASVLVLLGVFGLVMGCFWPPLMGWLSTGHSGAVLNRRLGAFNMSWSGGTIIGMLTSGFFYSLWAALPFLFCATALSVAVAMLAGVRSVKTHGEQAEASNTLHDPHPGLASFRQMARVGLVAAYLAVGIRTVMPLLIRQLGHGPEVHSIILTGGNVLMVGSFMVLKRTVGWHYRAGLLLGVQVVGAMLLGLSGLAGNVWLLGFPNALLFIGVAVVYNSHIYYAISSGRRRSGVMAVHEVLLAGGAALGSLGVGLVADWLGVRWAFVIAGGVWLAATAVQAGLYVGRRGADRDAATTA
jgi:MFS family permease